MKDKIIIYQDFALHNFGLAKSLQEIHDCDLYAIIDVSDYPNKFFQKQQIVKYTKTWFLYDHISTTKKNPDIDYLIHIEKKYGLELWKIAYNDRIFYRYNYFYKFTTDEVLSILEQEIRLFENVLDEVHPDFLILPVTDSGRMHIFYEICKIRGIKILMLVGSRFGYRVMISQEAESIDYVDEQVLHTVSNRTINELQNYLRDRSAFEEAVHYSNVFLKSKRQLIKAAIQFLIFSKNTNLSTHYTYYGRTKARVLFYNIREAVKRKYREYFINKNFIKHIDDNEKFIFFPLITEPERGLLIAAPFHTNLLELITHVVKSLPVGYKLYVKDHPSMSTRDWRPISFYKKIMNLPNVTMLHHSLHPDEILQKCSLVITIGGTAGLEAAFHEKPTITFVNALYTSLKSVTLLQNIEDLPKLIRVALNNKFDIKDLNYFCDLIDRNSFVFNWGGFNTDAHDHFFFGGFLADIEITESNMKSFLDKHAGELETLAKEHIKKIKQHKEHKMNST